LKGAAPDLNEILDEDLIGTTTDLQYARSKIVRKINEAIGETVDIGELRNIRNARLPGEPGSMGGIFETWVRKNYKSIGGRFELQDKLSFEDIQGTASKSSDIRFDSHYVPNEKTVVGVEIKSGEGAISGTEIDQAKRYGEIVNNPSLTKTIKNPNGFDNVFVEYIFLSEDAARKSMEKLLASIPQSNLKVYYIDNAGNMIKI
jgi:hypothetical protein